MRKLAALSAIALLAGLSAVVAEDNADLLQASYIGDVTGDDEKDTFAYDAKVPSDLAIRFNAGCLDGPVPTAHQEMAQR